VFLWDVATARTLRRWSGHFGRVNCVGFGGDGDSVVVSGEPPAGVMGPRVAQELGAEHRSYPWLMLFGRKL